MLFRSCELSHSAPQLKRDPLGGAIEIFTPPRPPMPETGKQRYLVAYNYGQGGLWAFVNARSAAEIQAKFPDLRIVTDPPPWLTIEKQNELQTFDLVRPTGWLAVLEEEGQ